MLKSPFLECSVQLRNAAQNNPPFSIGSSGEGVQKLQLALIGFGAKMPISTMRHGTMPDGLYGQETRAAVLAFQRQHGLTADGIAGKETIGKIDSLLVLAPQRLAEKAATDLSQSARRFLSTQLRGQPSILERRDFQSAIEQLFSSVSGNPAELFAVIKKGHGFKQVVRWPSRCRSPSHRPGSPRGAQPELEWTMRKEAVW